MKSLVVSLPRTIMEVYKRLPEGTLAELIDNVIYMSPSPVANHQKVLQTIFRKLSEQIEDNGRGEVIVAPFDVYLDEISSAVQPDIVVILTRISIRYIQMVIFMAFLIYSWKFFLRGIGNTIW